MYRLVVLTVHKNTGGQRYLMLTRDCQINMGKRGDLVTALILADNEEKTIADI